MADPSTLISESLAQALSDYRSVTEHLHATFGEMSDDLFVESRIATKFILSWMRDLRQFHRDFGNLFNRVKRPSIADDFTASVGICLNEFLKSRGHVGCVRSEEKTRQFSGTAAGC